MKERRRGFRKPKFVTMGCEGNVITVTEELNSRVPVCKGFGAVK